MDPNTFPTKGNLILAKNSLKLSRQGYELMDKKRNILIREMMDLIDQARISRRRLMSLSAPLTLRSRRQIWKSALPLSSRLPVPFL